METAAANTLIDTSIWCPGTHFFETSDGKVLMIQADLEEYPEGRLVKIRRRKTAVFYCDENGFPTPADMVPDHIFDPGTTPGDALAELGYALEDSQ